jgi:hypothetical protein
MLRGLRRSGYEVLPGDNLSDGSHRLGRGFELAEGDVADEKKLLPLPAPVDTVMHFLKGGIIFSNGPANTGCRRC